MICHELFANDNKIFSYRNMERDHLENNINPFPN